MELYTIESPLGVLEIEIDKEALSAVRFSNKPFKNKNNPSKVANIIIQELEEYFINKTIFSSFKLAPIGTPFQKKIWRLLSEIPMGETRSYTDIAIQYGNSKAVRAIGAAIGKNPIMIFIPCHRVIGSNGSMVGYAGGLLNKIWLLEHEGLLIQKRLNL
jgi:methylated-DNA-[protein]-cysteine S-methyltransferase|tara:strand:- start:1 stop:477 length:477 start_codon:yes stop_codon:yes gene_type:complete